MWSWSFQVRKPRRCRRDKPQLGLVNTVFAVCVCVCYRFLFLLLAELAPDEALRWLLGRIRAPPPTGLGLSVQIRAHESTKRTAFYLTAPINM